MDPHDLQRIPPHAKRHPLRAALGCTGFTILLAVVPGLLSLVGIVGPVVAPMVFVAVFIGFLFYFAPSRAMKFRLENADYCLCGYCGYDLRGSAESGPCPECGRDYTKRDTITWWRRHF